jgi:hypothetical protein
VAILRPRPRRAPSVAPAAEPPARHAGPQAEHGNSTVARSLGGGLGRFGADVAREVAAHSAGRPLPADVAARLGPALGHDVSHVTVHTDAPSAQAAEALHAEAFALGSHVFFAAGAWAPGTRTGDELLLHELQHVAQHDEGRLSDATAEQEADAAAHDAVGALDRAPPAPTLPQTPAPLLTELPAMCSPADGGYDLLGQEGRAEDEAEQDRLDAFDPDAYLLGFEAHGFALTLELLDASEALVWQEQGRYGLDVVMIDADRAADRDGMLAAAARLGLAMRTIAALHVKLDAMGGESPQESEGAAFFDGVAEGSDGSGSAPEGPGHEELYAELDAATAEYDRVRTESIEVWPVLAMYAPAGFDGTDLDTTLEATLDGATDAVYAAMAADLAERLEDIDTVRLALFDTLTVWDLPRVVALTKADLGVVPGSIEDATVDFEARLQRAIPALRDTALAVLGTALALAALGTEGATAPAALAVFGAITVNATLACQHLQDTMIQDAASGTDLDKAKALAGDPGWVWLALEIVALVADLGLAAEVMSALKPLAREALLAGTLSRDVGVLETADQLARSRSAWAEVRALGDDEVPGLGARVADRLEQRVPLLGDDLAALGTRADPADAALTADDFPTPALALKGDPATLDVARIRGFAGLQAEATEAVLARMERRLAEGADPAEVVRDAERELQAWRRQLHGDAPGGQKLEQGIPADDPNRDPFGDAGHWDGPSPERDQRVTIGGLIEERFAAHDPGPALEPVTLPPVDGAPASAFDAAAADVIQNRVTLPDGTVVDGNRLLRGDAVDTIDAYRNEHGKAPYNFGDGERYLTETGSPEARAKLHDAATDELGALLGRADDLAADPAARAGAEADFANAAYLMFQSPMVNRGSDATTRMLLVATYRRTFGRAPRLPQDIDVQAYARTQDDFVRWLLGEMAG